VVELQWYDTLEEAIQLALKVERQRRSKPYKAPTSKYGSSNKFTTPDSRISDNSVQRGSVVVNTKVEKSSAEKGKEIQGVENRRDTAGSSSRKTRQIKCFKCLGFRHMAAQCHNHRVMTAMEVESEDEEGEQDEPENVAAMLEEYYGDLGAEVHGDGGD